MLTRRFVLGTVQLGKPYGRRRAYPLMSEAHAFRILDAAWDAGVRAFDTAEAYGASAARLRAWSDARGNAGELEVVTKCAVDFGGRAPATIEDSAHAALTRFDTAGSVVLLTHGAVGADAWGVVKSVANKFGAGAGQSVYAPEEVSDACSLPGAVRVQAPGNVLDRRAIAARGESSVSLDIRSVYLQGVLLDPPEIAGRRAPGASGIARTVQAAAAVLGVELAPLLVAGVLASLRKDDGVVLGVDDASQLEVLRPALEMGEATVREFEAAIGHLADEAATRLVLDPRQWPTVGVVG